MNLLVKFSVIATLTYILLLSGCTSSGPLYKTGYDWDQSYDLSQYKSFTVIPPDNKSLVSPIMLKRVGNELASQLTAKGLQATQNKNAADFWVVVHATSETKVESIDYGNITYGIGSGRRRMGFYGAYGYPLGGTDVRSYEEGTLMIDFVDAAKEELVWRGYGSAQLRGQKIDDAQITEAVSQLLQFFPPSAANN